MSAPMYTGAATSKNTLGQICVISGIYFGWVLLYRWQEEIELGGIRRVVVDGLFVAMIVWLLYMANSATSVACWFVAAGLFATGRVPALAAEPRRLVLFFGVGDCPVRRTGDDARGQRLDHRKPGQEQGSDDESPHVGNAAGTEHQSADRRRVREFLVGREDRGHMAAIPGYHPGAQRLCGSVPERRGDRPPAAADRDRCRRGEDRSGRWNPITPAPCSGSPS